MREFWVLEHEKAPASITKQDNLLVLENRYIRRVIDLNQGKTVMLADGDGISAITAPLREAAVLVDGIRYEMGTENSAVFCGAVIREGNVTEGKFEYRPKSYNTHPYPYPAPGKSAELTWKIKDLSVRLVYEIFDDMPVMRKSFYVDNHGDTMVTIDLAETEALFLSEEGRLRLYLESDYMGGNFYGFQNSEASLHYSGDQVSAHFDLGPDYDLMPGRTFRGMQVYELFCQSVGFEHRMNEVQNMYRRVAPWVCEAPLFIHLISDESSVIRKTADILAEVSFDILIQSFLSGVDTESEDPDYIARIKSDYDYAHSKGIEVGGYTLACIRDYTPMNHDCALNGDHSQIMRCLCTKWSEGYWNRIMNFLEKTGSDFLEIDGPYDFSTCTGNRPGQTEHLHKGLSDSRYRQWLSSIVETGTRLRELGVYVNAPDWLFLSGTNKIAVGYEEISFSQPRLTQLLCSRIYNYLGTYKKIPSMGWSFLPVEEYHGGSIMAKFEPLTENLMDYDWALAQAAASGVWPCVRGKRLYDSELCRAVVKYWSDVIHRHRTLLNSNTVHVYPPKITENLNLAEDIDVILQENDTTRDKLFLMVCNQTLETRMKTLVLPAFYTGLTGLEQPKAAPVSGSFDEVKIPDFGSWPPIYPVNMENELCEYEPAGDSGIHMALYEHDLPEKRTEAMIDINGNLILTVTLAPMSYTYYVGYAVDDLPQDPIIVPEGKPFGTKLPEYKTFQPQEIRKIDFEAVKYAKNAEDVLCAMGLTEGMSSYDGNKVVVRKSAYNRIREILRQSYEGDLQQLMFTIAFVGIFTTDDPAIGEDEVYLLDGFRK